MASPARGVLGGPATPAAITREMTALTEKLYAHVRVYAAAEVEAAEARCEYDLALAHAFLAAEGSVAEREHKASLVIPAIRKKARVAEAVVKAYKAKIRAIEIDIDAHRTYGATVRAELKTLDYQGTP